MFTFFKKVLKEAKPVVVAVAADRVIKELEKRFPCNEEKPKNKPDDTASQQAQNGNAPKLRA